MIAHIIRIRSYVRTYKGLVGTVCKTIIMHVNGSRGTVTPPVSRDTIVLEIAQCITHVTSSRGGYEYGR